MAGTKTQNISRHCEARSSEAISITAYGIASPSLRLRASRGIRHSAQRESARDTGAALKVTYFICPRN